MTPFFADTIPDPSMLANAADKWGVVGVLSVICFALVFAVIRMAGMIQQKDKDIAAEKDKAIAERDRRIESEKQAGKEYVQKLESIWSRQEAQLTGFVDVAKATKQQLETLTISIERDQRSRP